MIKEDRKGPTGEYYLTDAVKLLHQKDLPVSVVKASNPDEVCGVNSVDQLEMLEKKFDRSY